MVESSLQSTVWHFIEIYYIVNIHDSVIPDILYEKKFIFELIR